jgi:hypothetical protein
MSRLLPAALAGRVSLIDHPSCEGLVLDPGASGQGRELRPHGSDPGRGFTGFPLAAAEAEKRTLVERFEKPSGIPDEERLKRDLQMSEYR